MMILAPFNLYAVAVFFFTIFGMLIARRFVSALNGGTTEIPFFNSGKPFFLFTLGVAIVFSFIFALASNLIKATDQEMSDLISCVNNKGGDYQKKILKDVLSRGKSLPQWEAKDQLGFCEKTSARQAEIDHNVQLGKSIN